MLISVTHLSETRVSTFQAEVGSCARLHKFVGTGEAGDLGQGVAVNQEPRRETDFWPPGTWKGQSERLHVGRRRGCLLSNQGSRDGRKDMNREDAKEDRPSHQ